mmetsp:Transcript_9681/g.41102  ORF Transcript_9681/g.41102 Transcript_9681/m.41102 type:complete len:246 (+) Transcript_9681:490-1227(+)
MTASPDTESRNDRARTAGKKPSVFFARSAFFKTAASALSSRSRSARLAISVAAASARISACVSCLGGSTFEGLRGPGFAFAASRASSDRRKMAWTPDRLLVRFSPAKANARSPPRSAGSGFTALALGAALETGGAFRSGALSAGLRRSLATATSSLSELLSSSSKSASNTSASSDSDSYFSSFSSSANASWFQNSSSALSSSSRSLFMRKPRVLRLGRAWDAIAPKEKRRERVTGAAEQGSTLAS